MRKRPNCFYIVNATMAMLVVVSFLISFFCPLGKEINSNNGLYNSAGIACQVITALVCCIASMIGISFSIQDTSFLGVKIKDLRELRVGKKYSMSCIMAISVLFVVSNLCLYLFKQVTASFGISLAAVIFCLYIICTEIPLMAKNEIAGIQILKDRMQVQIKASDVMAAAADDAVKYLISYKNLKNAYEKLSYGENETETNKVLLLKLLDLQAEIANQLDTIETVRIRRDMENAIGQNLRDILSFSFNIIDVLGIENEGYKNTITRTIIGLSAGSESGHETSRVVYRALESLDYLGNNSESSEKKDFLISILLSLFTYAVRIQDKQIINAVIEYYSLNSYRLANNSNSKLLFSLYSLHLYYICNLEHNVPDDLKDNVKTLVFANPQIVDYKTLYPWGSLFKEHLSSGEVDYTEYMRAFLNNEFSMEFLVIASSMSWVVMDEDLAFQWYITNLLFSAIEKEIDYCQVFGSDPEGTTFFNLKRLLHECYKDNDEFVMPDYMKDILAFWDIQKDGLGSFLFQEQHEHALFSYLNGICAKALIREASMVEEQSNQMLREQIHEQITKALEKEWGRDTDLKIDSDKRYMKILVEKEQVPNLGEALSDYFIRSLFHSIRNELIMKTVAKDNRFDEFIREMLTEDIEATADNTSTISYYINDEELQKAFLERIQLLEKYTSHILPRWSMVLKGGFNFNVIIEGVDVERLHEDQINDRINREYKRTDGQYVYAGAFMSREEVYQIVQKKAVIITVSVRYRIDAQAEKIIKFELFPNGENEIN